MVITNIGYQELPKKPVNQYKLFIPLLLKSE